MTVRKWAVGRQTMSCVSNRVDWVLVALVIAYNVLMAGATAAFCVMTYIAVR